MNSAASSDSAADAMTNLMIWAIDRMVLLNQGKGSSSKATLGESRVFTLGLVGVGWWVSQRDGGASERHDSKISQCAVIVLSWETLVGGGAPQMATATTCKLWMILSSVEGTGTERYA
jgi:hypothetical protein